MKQKRIGMKAKMTMSAVGMVLMGMSHYTYADIGLAFPQISRQIMMSKLKRSHANGTNEICPRVQVRGGQTSHR